MSVSAMGTGRKADLLPESDQQFAREFVKKLVLAWDPDFTKVTPEEAAQIREAETSGFIPEDEIDWDDLSQYQ